MNVIFLCTNNIICKCFSVFPKTDYTYSKASQCRYEIAPGILAMPNMSRRSIHSDTDSSIEISNKTLSQTVQRTGSKISDSDTVDLKDKTLAHLVSNCYLLNHYCLQNFLRIMYIYVYI